jgi:choline dehydrogenase-like flavoprotein
MDSFQRNDFDAIAVGSGLCGAAVAKELSQRGGKTLILEWGRGDFFIKAEQWIRKKLKTSS